MKQESHDFSRWECQVAALQDGESRTKEEWFKLIKEDNTEMHERYPENENCRLFSDDEIRQIMRWLDDVRGE